MLLLMPMLGVAWLIGLTVNAHFAIGYIFDIMSSLQVTFLKKQSINVIGPFHRHVCDQKSGKFQF